MPILHPLLSPVAIATFAFVLALLTILVTKTSAMFLVGLLGYVLTRHLQAMLLRRGHAARWQGGLIMTVSTVALLALLVSGLSRLLASDQIDGLLHTTAEALQNARQHLPAVLVAQIPDSAAALKTKLGAALATHAGWLTGVSTKVLGDLLLALIAWIIGIMLALAPSSGPRPPEFQAAWHRHWKTLTRAFETVAFAQIKISAANASLLALFLLGLMPLLGWQVPYAKALILLSFLIGLLPVIGNLIVNSLVFAIALGSSLAAAASCLAFLSLIHKFEYFLLARFVGRKTDTRAWEILVALFAFQILFGAGGLVIAPIIYAYSKDMLKQVGWLRS